MRKLTAIFLSLVLLAVFVSPSFAAVGIKRDGTPICTATDLNFTDAGASVSCDGSTLTFATLLGGFGSSGATSMTSFDTAVSPSYAFIRKDIANENAGLSAGTLADGTPGQILTIYISRVQGSGTFVLTPTTKTGFTSLTFNAVGDQATLLFVDSTTGWVILSTTSVTVAQP